MTKQQIATVLTTLCAASALSVGAMADKHANKSMDKKHANKNMENKHKQEHPCQNNQCKGHADCGAYGNASCHGQNTCAGKGFVEAKDQAECEKVVNGKPRGIWHGAKAAAPAATKK
jgi:hypothetical protein